ncbi:heme ABC transporter permease CcmC [Fretibacter rubidus]|uniref:heme ABC transporter permease CcmC n=1 Tax=Fretibacter rubidus TaxID=570162 RepID=UPI003529EB02
MITYLANPVRFQRFARYASPILGGMAIIALIIGLYLSLVASPAERDQGDAVRIMYVHVPAAWCAMAAYTGLAVASFVSFVWRHPLADSAAKACALPGAAMTFLALATGSLWGKPIWNTWWEWDGRMTSVLVLLFIYLAYMAIWATIEDKKRAARLASIFAMVGWINIPIIKYSVEWWNSLHQPASISKIGAPSMPIEIIAPLLTMALAYTCLLGWLVINAVLRDIRIARAERQTAVPNATVTIETI